MIINLLFLLCGRMLPHGWSRESSCVLGRCAETPPETLSRCCFCLCLCPDQHPRPPPAAPPPKVIEARLVWGMPRDGCSFPHGYVRGAILMVQRGNCYFHKKAALALRAGARAVLVVDNSAGEAFVMEAPTDHVLKIPIFSISRKGGGLLKYLFSRGPVTVRCRPACLREGVVLGGQQRRARDAGTHRRASKRHPTADMQRPAPRHPAIDMREALECLAPIGGARPSCTVM